MVDNFQRFRAMIREAKRSNPALGTSYTSLLGTVIAILRQQNGMSQTILSKSSGVSQSTLSRIELGEADITAPQMDRIATALGTRPSAIFDSADEVRRILQEEEVPVPVKTETYIKDAATGAGIAVAGSLMLGPIGLLAGSIVGAMIANRNDKNKG